MKTAACLLKQRPVLRRSVFVSVFVTGLFAATLAAAPTSAQSNSATAAKSATIESAVIERIRNTGEVRIGHRADAKPYSFRKGEQVTGYTVDVCRRVLERVQKKLGLKSLALRYVPIDPQSRFDKLAKGEIDLECGSSVTTRAAQGRVETSYWVLVTGVKVLTRPRADLEEKDVPLHVWLKRKKIAVCAKCANRAPLERFLKGHGVDAELVATDEPFQAYLALEQGKVDAAAINEIGGQSWMIDRGKQTDFVFSGRALSADPVAVLLPKQDAGWAKLFNNELAGVLIDGEIWPIYDRWIGKQGLKIQPPAQFLEAVRFPTNYAVE